jgi:hypothetical protein
VNIIILKINKGDIDNPCGERTFKKIKYRTSKIIF